MAATSPHGDPYPRLSTTTGTWTEWSTGFTNWPRYTFDSKTYDGQKPFDPQAALYEPKYRGDFPYKRLAGLTRHEYRKTRKADKQRLRAARKVSREALKKERRRQAARSRHGT